MEQHVQVPNTSKGLTPYDLLVYASIKTRMDNTTKTAHPSKEYIMKMSSLGKKQVNTSINRLEEEKWIKVDRQAKSTNVYTFIKKDDGFECFSFDFLKLKIPKEVKAYIIATQKFMFINDLLRDASINYSEREIAKKINATRAFVSAANKWMASKDIMSTVPIKTRDSESGLYNQTKIYNLEKLGQALVFKVQEMDERLQTTENKTDHMSKMLNDVIKRVELLERANKLKNVEDATILVD